MPVPAADPVAVAMAVPVASRRDVVFSGPLRPERHLLGALRERPEQPHPDAEAGGLEERVQLLLDGGQVAGGRGRRGRFLRRGRRVGRRRGEFRGAGEFRHRLRARGGTGGR